MLFEQSLLRFFFGRKEDKKKIEINIENLPRFDVNGVSKCIQATSHSPAARVLLCASESDSDWELENERVHVEVR